MSAAVLNDDESVFITENSLPLDTKEEATSDTAIQADIAAVDDSLDEDEKLRLRKLKKKKRKSKKKYKYRRKSVSSSDDSGAEYDDKEAKKRWENLYYDFQKVYYKNNGHYYTDGSAKFIKSYYKKYCLSNNNNDDEDNKVNVEVGECPDEILDTANDTVEQPMSPEEVLKMKACLFCLIKAMSLPCRHPSFLVVQFMTEIPIHIMSYLRVFFWTSVLRYLLFSEFLYLDSLLIKCTMGGVIHGWMFSTQ